MNQKSMQFLHNLFFIESFGNFRSDFFQWFISVRQKCKNCWRCSLFHGKLFSFCWFFYLGCNFTIGDGRVLSFHLQIEHCLQSQNWYAWLASLMSHATENIMFDVPGCAAYPIDRRDHANIWKVCESRSSLEDIASWKCVPFWKTIAHIK